MQDVKMFMVT